MYYQQAKLYTEKNKCQNLIKLMRSLFRIYATIYIFLEEFNNFKF